MKLHAPKRGLASTETRLIRSQAESVPEIGLGGDAGRLNPQLQDGDSEELLEAEQADGGPLEMHNLSRLRFLGGKWAEARSGMCGYSAI
jgi:hypothetical protein